VLPRLAVRIHPYARHACKAVVMTMAAIAWGDTG
jgi:hypothetical protein